MAFGLGIDVSDFNNRDSYDYGKQIGKSSKARAQDFLDSFMETNIVGGSATKSTAEAKRMELLGEANAYANQQQQNAQTVGALASFAGGMGTIGASKGGFSGFFDQWKGWGNSGGGGNSFAGVPNSVLDSVLKQP